MRALWTLGKGALALAVVLGLVFAAWGWLRELPYRGGPDYGTMPPAKAFEKILGYPPPPGVTNLRVTGHSFWNLKFRAWMSFDATDAALRSMLNEDFKDPTTGADATKYAHDAGRLVYFPDSEDKRRVGWEEVPEIKNPLAYMFCGGGKPGLLIWCGWMIVDRKQHRAYVQLDGD